MLYLGIKYQILNPIHIIQGAIAPVTVIVLVDAYDS